MFKSLLPIKIQFMKEIFKFKKIPKKYLNYRFCFFPYHPPNTFYINEVPLYENDAVSILNYINKITKNEGFKTPNQLLNNYPESVLAEQIKMLRSLIKDETISKN